MPWHDDMVVNLHFRTRLLLLGPSENSRQARRWQSENYVARRLMVRFTSAKNEERDDVDDSETECLRYSISIKSLRPILFQIRFDTAVLIRFLGVEIVP